MSRRVVVITDSSASLPADLVERYAITVVPLHVSGGGISGSEGVEVTPAQVVAVLKERGARITTSRPSPALFEVAYQQAFGSGATAVVSIHLSAALSGTWETARFVGSRQAGRVEVVNSGSTAMGLGFAVLAAAVAAQEGGDVTDVLQAAYSTMERTTVLFYVDTLEYLRRGGRIGTAAALLGTALSVKPLLSMSQGMIRLKEKVRTTSKALARLETLAEEAAGVQGCDLAVHHLAAPERATALAQNLRERIPLINNFLLCEVGAAVGAHVGPGFVGAVVVSR